MIYMLLLIIENNYVIKIYMFEFVPFLKGMYLTYGEYFALVVGVIVFGISVVTYLIGRFCYSRAKV